MERQTLKQKLGQVLKDTTLEEMKEILNEAKKALCSTSNEAYNSTNAL